MLFYQLNYSSGNNHKCICKMVGIHLQLCLLVKNNNTAKVNLASIYHLLSTTKTIQSIKQLLLDLHLLPLKICYSRGKRSKFYQTTLQIAICNTTHLKKTTLLQINTTINLLMSIIYNKNKTSLHLHV